MFHEIFYFIKREGEIFEKFVVLKIKEQVGL